MQWLLIFKLVVLLTVANGTPGIAAKLFGKYFNQPLDWGVAFVDGRLFLDTRKRYAGSYFHLWRLPSPRPYSVLHGHAVSSSQVSR